jgi:parvulin-like peptidyl-prolyl isomerase
MKQALQTNCLVLALFLITAIMSGCAKHAPVSQPLSPAATAINTSDSRKIVVAKVNGVELHMDALVNMMNRLAPKEGVTTPESLENHKKRSLDKLILQELAYQQAKALGIGIGADKIDMAIKNLKENVGGEKEYVNYLAKMNVSEMDLRSQVERSLTIELIYAREVLAKVTVPEDEVGQEYEKEKHLYIVPEKASVIDVYVLKHDGKASTKKAKELLRKIKSDAAKDPWKLVLDGTFIVRDLDVNKNKEQELFEAAKKLKPNELSGVIEIPTGSHIIKMKNYSPERQLTFNEVKSKMELKFKVPAQEKRTQEWEQELRKDAKVEIVDSGVGRRESEVGG